MFWSQTLLVVKYISLPSGGFQILAETYDRNNCVPSIKRNHTIKVFSSKFLFFEMYFNIHVPRSYGMMFGALFVEGINEGRIGFIV